MNINKTILLPGTDKQLEFLLSKVEVKDKSILVMGAASESITEELQKRSAQKVQLIMEDFDSFINATLKLEGNENIEVRMMEFERTDFEDSQFDLIYAQASVSGENRKAILKEMKRILKDDGRLCIGEIVLLKEDPPRFVLDILETSALQPLISKKVNEFYVSKGLTVMDEKNISETLQDYYSMNEQKLFSVKKDLSEKEKSYYKKLINQLRHEANAYLNLGADKYIGFKTIIARKK